MYYISIYLHLKCITFEYMLLYKQYLRKDSISLLLQPIALTAKLVDLAGYINLFQITKTMLTMPRTLTFICQQTLRDIVAWLANLSAWQITLLTL